MSGVCFDSREESGFFVVVVGVDSFVPCLAVDEEIGDVFWIGDLLELEDDGVEAAGEQVVDEAHVVCYFHCFFGDLRV